MLDNSSGKIVAGGTMDADKLFIEPTLVEVTDVSDSLLVEESFGPLMPVSACRQPGPGNQHCELHSRHTSGSLRFWF